jgi:uncharacterized protein YacL
VAKAAVRSLLFSDSTVKHAQGHPGPRFFVSTGHPAAVFRLILGCHRRQPRREVALEKKFTELLYGSGKLLWILRFLFFMVTVSIASDALVFALDDASHGVRFAIGMVAAMIAIILCVGTMILDMITKSKEITTLSAIYFGLLLGFLIGSLFWTVVKPLLHQYLEMAGLETRPPGGVAPGQGVLPAERIETLAQFLITAFSCYLAVSTLLQTKDEFRFIIPYVEFSKQLKGAKPLVLDTSVIIDGRIADICDTGIIDTKLLVPRFVLQELQGIADSSDKIRRNRGRRGLDVLKRLQTNTKIELQMHEGNLPELREVTKVDERLVVFAKSLSARVVTNDFNLNKICQLQGVDVINLNELSNALKLVALPGELLHVKIVKQGDQIGQGVGYLDDGTMVVVEQGRQAIGQDVAITVTSVLQTPAGRMIFGRISGTGEHAVMATSK